VGREQDWRELQGSINSCVRCGEVGQGLTRGTDRSPARPPLPQDGSLLFLSEAPPAPGGFWRATPNLDDLREGLFDLLREAGAASLSDPHSSSALDDFVSAHFFLLQTVKWPLIRSAANLGPAVRRLIEHNVRDHLSAELLLARPRAIVCLGKVACYAVSIWNTTGEFVFKARAHLDSVRGRFSSVVAPDGRELPVYVTALPVDQNLRVDSKRQRVAREIGEAFAAFADPGCPPPRQS
jgi:hypothetical protein